MNKKILTFLTYLILFVNSNLLCAEENKTLKIGLLAPLSGEYEDLGNSLLYSLQLALDEIDDDKVFIIPRDTGFNDKEKFNKAIDDIKSQGAKIIIGPIGNKDFQQAKKHSDIIFISPSNISPELKVKVDATNSSKIEILDADTNHTIATRLIPSDGIVTAANKSLRFVGDTNINDEFTILNNFEGIGDNRNILEMISLQEADLNGANSGSFQDIFNSTVAEIGSTVRSGQLSLQDAEATRDEAKAAEDERAGVSLDEEASALIQFQQAFSANARIIQTARELFDSLMMVVSK